MKQREDSKSIIKNNNPRWHSLANESKCKICLSDVSNLGNHYVNFHPNYEVFPSRVAPHVAEVLRDSKVVHQCEKIFDKPRLRYLYSQCCYFCNETKSLDKNCWINHIARHTGYYQYQCKYCCKKFVKADHKCPGNGKVEFVSEPSQIHFVAQFDKINVMAYLCDFCNFVRFDTDDIQNHLKSEHDGEENAKFKAVIFLRFPQNRKSVPQNWKSVAQNRKSVPQSKGGFFATL